MPRTGQLGTFLSQPGNLVLGYGSQLGVGVTWAGPFIPTELEVAGPYAERLLAGQRVVVYPNIASQLAVSDPGWWVFG